MGEVIVITSGKGGVGKTTTTANLGSALALKGKKVALVDTDIGSRNLDVVMGLENRIVYDIVDVVEEKCKLKQALIKDKRFNELYLLPAAQTRDKSAIDEEQMKDLVGKLKEEFDYILIDCPAGIEQGFKNAIVGADRAIVVTMAEISAIRDADRIIGLLEANEIITKYPLYITRDLNCAKKWLRDRILGNKRVGLTASSGGLRLKSYGINVKEAIDEAYWFLNDETDVRSSYYLEMIATEFAVQGLELDWVGICWDSDLRRLSKSWDFKNFSGTTWKKVHKKEDQQYLLNTCLLYTSDAANERYSVDLGGRRIIKKKNRTNTLGRRC